LGYLLALNQAAHQSFAKTGGAPCRDLPYRPEFSSGYLLCYPRV